MRLTLHICGITAAALLATGCSMLPTSSTGSPSATAAQPRPVERCDSAKAQWAVGKTNTEQNVAEARKRAGAYVVRVLRPGQPTTREFNAERLNLEVDATGRVIAARCG